MRWPAGGIWDLTRVFRTALSGGFPCGFSVVDRLGPLYEAGQAVGLYRRQGLLNSGFRA